ncbi:MAG: serine protease [Burkholderiales bacterium]|nr:serine protease [Burkholderiales bacterium]
MARPRGWAFPPDLQPRAEDYGFDLDAALESMVLVRAEIPEDAFTASFLGTERAGNGVVIREDGLVLTIGYLVTEATTLWLTSNQGAVIAGHVVAYDHPSGFALLQPLGNIGLPALERGSSASCDAGDEVLVAGHGGRAHSLKASVVAKREFAGYWDYVLDEAIYTAPAHPQWGGTALIGRDGRLIGIGSLLVQEAIEGNTVQGNMYVPIDLLEPILEDMVRIGRADRPPRPWLGMYSGEAGGRLVVAGITDGGPADQAGVAVGDVLLEVAGQRVDGLADLFRKVWRVGPAGTVVPLTIERDGVRSQVRVESADRQSRFKKPHLH